MSDERLAFAGATAAAYTEKRWGGPVRLVPLTQVGLLAGTTRALQNNPRRMAWWIGNVGSANCYIGFDATTASNLGILIPPVGGSVQMDVDEDGELVTYEVWVNVPTGGGPLVALEIVRK